MSGLRLHARRHAVNAAGLALGAAIDKIAAEHDLTFGELVGLIAGELASIAKYEIRFERHGNTDTPGGLAPEDGT